MNVDAVRRIRAKAEAAEVTQSDFLDDRTNELTYFVRERAVTEFLGEQLAMFLSKEAIDLASSDSEIEQAVSDLVFKFTKRAAALDIEIKAGVMSMSKPLEIGTMGADNLAIWDKVKRVDPRATKDFDAGGGRIMTAVNPTYVDRMATEIFGIFGTHWGVDIVSENFDKGAPLMRLVTKDGAQFKELILDSNGGYLTELHHTVLIKLWYSIDGERGEVLAYGCTRYLWADKHGIRSDGEARKKSMTDAKKKALSQLGFAADVFEGKFEDIDYVSEVHAEFSLKRAEESETKAADLINELIEKADSNVKTIQTASTASEINGIIKVSMRTIDANISIYQGKGDMESVTRLNNIKKALDREAEKRKAALEKKKQLAEEKRNKKGEQSEE